MHLAIRFVALMILAVASASTARAQSLGAIARQEEARRKSVAKPGKVYTNETLRGAGDVGAQASPAAAAAAESGPALPPAPPEAAPAEEKPDPRKNQSYWRDRVTKTREGLERAQSFKEALQSRINSLTADFASRDDPAQRGRIGVDRRKALAEFDRVTREIADFERQLRNIEEEARKAGVLPGWVR